MMVPEPEPVPMQVPVDDLKHPLESWMPLAKVEVAVVEVALMTGTLIAV